MQSLELYQPSKIIGYSARVWIECIGIGKRKVTRQVFSAFGQDIMESVIRLRKSIDILRSRYKRFVPVGEVQIVVAEKNDIDGICYVMESIFDVVMTLTIGEAQL